MLISILKFRKIVYIKNMFIFMEHEFRKMYKKLNYMYLCNIENK